MRRLNIVVRTGAWMIACFSVCACSSPAGQPASDRVGDGGRTHAEDAGIDRVSDATSRDAASNVDAAVEASPILDVAPAPVLDADLIDARSIAQDDSLAMGFENSSNTCFANSPLKFLSAFGGLDDFLSQDLSIPDAGAADADTFLPLRVDLQTKLRGLYRSYFKNKNQWFSDPSLPLERGHYQAELNRVFDAFNALVDAEGRPLDSISVVSPSGIVRNQELRLKRDQIDTDVFFERLAEYLNYEKAYGGLARLYFIKYEDGSEAVVGTNNLSPVAGLGIDESFIGAADAGVERTLREIVEKNLSEQATEGNRFQSATKSREVSRHGYFGIDSSKAPDHIVMMLHRFRFEVDGTKTKLRNRVSLSPEIEFEFIDANNRTAITPVDKKTYKPAAVIVHRGSAGNQGGGHYFAYVYEAQKKMWYLHNDTYIKECGSAENYAEFIDTVTTDGYYFLYSIDRGP